MYAIVDIETTGGNHKSGRITEIAVYEYDNGRITELFQSLVNPECSIPPFVQNLTGITNKMVAKAPVFEEISEELYEVLNSRIFVAHNVSFDYNFIKTSFNRFAQQEFNVPYVCTIQLSRKILPGYGSYGLGKLCKEIGIEINGRHRAAGDALATAKLFDILMQKDRSAVLSLIKGNINR
ncbi:MAG TPA: DNA polymerase III subunit epsilon [Flavobacteriales bacterium]|nr:DNA polymerase III subunit epsilon [Flavobacteriales bacterium]|tara:strand:- start:8859 stop:9398 length:540 start_codon:yes stop_codon:yes gene_type:complete